VYNVCDIPASLKTDNPKMNPLTEFQSELEKYTRNKDVGEMPIFIMVLATPTSTAFTIATKIMMGK
jgi:hypothetical protein